MRNDGQNPKGAVTRSGRSNGFIPNSFRAISSYLRIVSSGASTVASTVRSAGASVASSIVDREDVGCRNQVHWAGFDKLESEEGIIRRVLLLGYRSGFQVWDVEEADNVYELISRYDGPVSFLQMQPKPIESKKSEDKFADVRPLLIVVGDGFLSGGINVQDGVFTQCNGNDTTCHETGNGNFVPTVVRFYSLRSQSYVHILKFRSAVFSVRCSPRVVAISQAAQIHCFEAATLEREYTILTYPVFSGCPGFGNAGYGPLAVGPRWLAYSGSPVVISNTGRVSPQHLTPSASFSGSSSNGNVVVHYAKESSKQLAAGIATLGDMGYKKLSRYCSELLPDCNNSLKSGSPGWKTNGTVNGHLSDVDNAGMVIVRDIVGKSVLTQFRAHRSPISALCFDPSGTLLVTASVQGHNINVFRIMPMLPRSSSGSDSHGSYVHLYRLQRGLTNAVIQDISFSADSQWIMISSLRGTSHLFAISPCGGSVNLQSAASGFTNSVLGVMTKQDAHWPHGSGPEKLNQQNFSAFGPPVTLSVVSRIRNGGNGWRGTVSGAAAVATGRVSSLSGAIASTFHNCKENGSCLDSNSLSTKYHLLVFSPSGCLMQYVLRTSNGPVSESVSSRLNTAYESLPDSDAKLVVEAVQKWDICQRQHQREREDNLDIYGEHGNGDNHKIFPEGKRGNGIYPANGLLVTKTKSSAEERHHLYISEAELQMHQARIPMWAKPEIYFQVMMMDYKNIKESVLGGEIEIEQFPTRMIEARSKDLVPVFEHLQTPKFQETRVPALDSNCNVLLQNQRSRLSEDGRVSCGSRHSSLDYVSEGSIAATELPNTNEENCWGGLQMSLESTAGFVNNNNMTEIKNGLEFVDNREKIETYLEFVNNNKKKKNNKESLKMENHLKDDDGELD